MSPETTQSLPVMIVADFVCPWSYLMVESADRLVAEYGVEPLWRPHWLRPDVPQEGMPFPDRSRRDATIAWIADAAPEAAARMQFPDKIHSSLKAFEALAFAEAAGREFSYKSAVFDALWVRGLDIGTIPTLTEAAEEVGLDGEEMEEALVNGTYAAQALNDVDQARRIGITATPTIFLGRVRVDGWHYYEVLQSVLEEQGVQPIV